MGTPVSNHKRYIEMIGLRFFKKIWIVAMVALSLSGAMAVFAQNPQAQTIGPSGNPLPRFVSLSASKAFLRTGPGRQYPIDWVYSRRNLPLEVIDEHGAWRKVRDHEGVTGWMLVSLLSGKRTAMIRGKARNLHTDPEMDAPILLVAEPGVIGSIEGCEGLWCEVTVDGDSAWIERRHIWGVYPGETID